MARAQSSGDYNLALVPQPRITLLRTPGPAPRVLTIDAEDWFHVCGEDYYSDWRRWDSFPSRIEKTFLQLLDVLEEGDASATPVPPLGRFDNPLGPYRVEGTAGAIVEIPPLTGRGFGRRLPVGGGWPFRLLPEERIAAAERTCRDRGHPAVFTFHPWEFDTAHRRMEGLPPLLRTVHFLGLRVLPDRFRRWLSRDRSVALKDVLGSLEAA